MAKRFSFLLLAALSACVKPLALPIPPDGEVITYETMPGPFCGNCASYKIAVGSDGRVAVEEGHWEGNYTDWRASRWTARLSSRQVVPFREQLALYRPDGDRSLRDAKSCDEFWTDSPEVKVTWQSARATSRLIYNYGCDPTTQHTMAEALRTAPSLLPLRYLRVPFTQPLATTRTK
jgi:hypothetical protein